MGDEKKIYLATHEDAYPLQHPACHALDLCKIYDAWGLEVSPGSLSQYHLVQC